MATDISNGDAVMEDDWSAAMAEQSNAESSIYKLRTQNKRKFLPSLPLKTNCMTLKMILTLF